MPEVLEEKPLLSTDMVYNNDGESKEYLLCIKLKDTDEYNNWRFIIGRSALYNYIKNQLLDSDIDIVNSFVISSNVTLSNRKSVYAFMKYASGLLHDEYFDIDDYMDFEDDSTPTYNEVTAPFYDSLKNLALRMQDLMNKNKNLEEI